MSRCLAYFITFRTYGTWLHGDGRGSVRWSADGPTFDPLPNPAIERYSKARMKVPRSC